jgi:hypothetical protein
MSVLIFVVFLLFFEMKIKGKVITISAMKANEEVEV